MSDTYERNYALVTRAQCYNNDTNQETRGSDSACFFEPKDGSFKLRDGYRIEQMGEYNIAKAGDEGSANRRCLSGNNTPCMQSQKDFENCGRCVKNPAVKISETQKNITQTTGDNFYLKYWYYPHNFSKDLNSGHNESIQLNPRLPSNNQYGEWYHTTSQPEDWTPDYEVYTIQNPGDNSEILKICVRKVGNLREGYQYEYTEPQIPVKISRYLHDTSRLSKIKGNVQDNRYGVGGNTYNWGGYYWYKQSDTSEKYTEDNYKAHLDKFNNYNLEIRIHPDYEDKYKFGMGTKDNNPTSTNVFTHWYLGVWTKRVRSHEINANVDGGISFIVGWYFRNLF